MSVGTAVSTQKNQLYWISVQRSNAAPPPPSQAVPGARPGQLRQDDQCPDPKYLLIHLASYWSVISPFDRKLQLTNLDAALETAHAERNRFIAFAFAVAELVIEANEDGDILFAAGAAESMFGVSNE